MCKINKDAFLTGIFKVLPQAWLSCLFGHFASLKRPYFVSYLSKLIFSKLYQVNLDQAELSLAEYSSLQDFFTRKLKVGARPLADAKIVSPADGRIRDAGSVQDRRIYQVKSKPFSLQFLLGDKWSESFQQGSFINIYLSPTDYHRVHMPLDAEIIDCKAITGKLWPVTDWAIRGLDDLYAQNSRIVTIVKSGSALYAIVLVAAFNVGDMQLSFNSEAPVVLNRGDHFGTFRLGSSVLLFSQSAEFANTGLAMDQHIKVNSALVA